VIKPPNFDSPKSSGDQDVPGEGATAMAAIGLAEPREAPAKFSSMVDQDAGKIENEDKPKSVEAVSGGNTSMD
jgi:hypothetical protein